MSVTPRQRALGVALQLATLFCVVLGGAAAKEAMLAATALVVVAGRQLVATAVIVPMSRMRPRSWTWSSVRPAIALGITLVIMNACYYEAVTRIGLGMSTTLEFLGPFAIALLGSRRLLDVLCVIVVSSGVLLLTLSGGPIDPTGVGFALIAAAGWAFYIVFARRAALALPGIQGLGIGSVLAALVLVPLALTQLDIAALDARVLVLIAAAGLLSSAIPYSIDPFVLRRISASLFAIITSLEPALAAAAGILLLGESITLWQGAGILAVCLGAGVSIATRR